MSAGAGPQPLLERDDELRHIERALAHARDGRGSLLAIEGPAGIGKSSVLATGRVLAAEMGMQVLHARGAELDGEFAFGIVHQLLEPPLAAARPDERRELVQGPARNAVRLLNLPGGDTDPADAGDRPSEATFAALHGLYWLCANLAAVRPLVLAVDDAHWADAPSLRFLNFLLPRLEELPLAIVLASRPGEPGPGLELLDALIADPVTDVVRPAPLTPSGVAVLAREQLGAEPEAAFVDAVARATGSTPFLVRSLLESLADAGDPPTAASVPAVMRMGSSAVARWLQLRLTRLPPACARLARAGAILESADLRQAAELAELGASEAATASDMLVAAQIIVPGTRIAFAHPMLRTAVYDEMGSALRAEWHRRAARLLADGGAADDIVAKHLVAGEPAGDPLVVDRLVGAARAAARAGASESAIAYLRRAIEEPPAADRRPGLLLELGMAEANAGLDAATERLAAAVAAAPDGSGQGTAALVLGYVLGRMNRFTEALEVFDRAAAGLGPGDERLALALEAAALIHVTLDARLASANAERIRAARQRALLDEEAPRELLAVAALVAMQSNESADEAAELARRAIAAGPRPLPAATDVPWFPLAAGTLIWTERYSDVEPLLAAAVDEARAEGDVALLSGAVAYRGLLELRRGRLLAAEADALTALDPGFPVPMIYRVLNAAVLVEALVDKGDLEAAEAVVAPLAGEAEEGLQSAAILRHARGRLRIAQRRVEEGLADLVAVGEVTTATLAPCPSFLPWRSHAAMAHLALGQRDSALRLAREELDLARDFGTPRALGVALRAAGLAHGGDEGEALLREAVVTLASAEAPLERARALAGLGGLLRRTNRRAEARDLLAEALALARDVRARALGDEVETELQATGARPRKLVLTGLDSLTASERRVAELAVEGLSNREIAQSLFVTERTVEGHLSRVFQKLEVSSRESLPDALAEAVA